MGRMFGTDYWLLATGYWLPATGYSVPCYTGPTRGAGRASVCAADGGRLHRTACVQRQEVGVRERQERMDSLILRAERRTVVGKKVKRLRREGRVPGIVYGPVVTETIPVSVDRREFEKFFMTNGHSTLFTLQWEGGEQPVFIREVQEDAVRRAPVHVDFFAPNLRKELTALVPVVFLHANPDVEGVVAHLKTEIDVRGLPSNIPHQVEADLSALRHVGDELRVAELTLPAGVTAETPGEEILAHVVPQTAPEE